MNNENVCPVCHGTGIESYELDTSDVYGSKPDGSAVYSEYGRQCTACNGVTEERRTEAKKNADLPADYYENDINDVDWGIYERVSGKVFDLSQQQIFVNSFLSDFDKWSTEGIGLYFWSRIKGSGKSYIASAICNELIERNAINARYVSASNLLSMIQNASRDKYATQYDKDPVLELCECRLLILDDLGQKDTGTKWLNDVLFRICDERLQNKRVTLATSNMPIGELNLDDRVIDRMNAMMQMVPLPEVCVRAYEAARRKQDLFRNLGLIKNR